MPNFKKSVKTTSLVLIGDIQKYICILYFYLHQLNWLYLIACSFPCLKSSNNYCTLICAANRLLYIVCFLIYFFIRWVICLKRIYSIFFSNPVIEIVLLIVITYLSFMQNDNIWAWKGMHYFYKNLFKCFGKVQ